MKMRWLGTAGFELRSGDTVILLDPYLTRNGRARPVQPLHADDFQQADAILVSHGHFDHTYDVPRIAINTGARVICRAGVCNSLRARSTPWSQVQPMEPFGKLQIGEISVTALPSRHVDFDTSLVLKTLARSAMRMPEIATLGAPRFPLGGVFIYLLEVEGKRILHMGSAHLEPGIADRVTPVDIFLVPVQGRSDIQELAVRLTKEIKPTLAIPHHHDSFYPPLSQMVDLHRYLAGVAREVPGTMVVEPHLNRWIEL